ncbi:MAG: hypothetical protein PVH61_12980 [Candidatus Aminicenantes bacterium]|jgi:hypothetical protein
MMRTKLSSNQQHLSALKSLSKSLPVRTALRESPVLEPLPEPLKKWLGSLALLYGVPFHHIAAADRMLPTESVRFFFVDENWINSLLDGALSIGIHSSRDTLIQETAREILREDARLARQMVRREIVGAPEPKQVETGGTTAGMLMRSAVVSGWTGLEIKGYEDKEGKKPIDKLRMNKLAPDVMLVIFAKVPLRIDVSEPKEGLSFGKASNGKILPKFLDKNKDQPVGTYVTQHPTPDDYITPTYRQGSERVLEVIKTKDLIKDALKNKWDALPTDQLRPAEFAIEMVKTAEQQKFINKGTSSALLKQESSRTRNKNQEK